MQEKEIYFDLLIKQAQKALTDHFFEVVVHENKAQALDFLVRMIGKDSVIGFGGSKTLTQIGFFDHFTKQKYGNFLDRNDPSLTPEQKHDLQIKALSSDFFLCSANSISTDGKLVLIDKWGNRNAAATFGPKKRIFIAGANKIAADIDGALYLAKNRAAVLNNIRFDTKNPCTIKGTCRDCSGSNRLCSVTTIIERSMPQGSALVILIKEDLGF